MKILQLIDSLHTGGAERMAVSYANALADMVEVSGLAATRQEGSLKNQLNEKVKYLFLNKKSAVDCNAVWRLRKFIRENKIDVIHAHSTSFFTAVLVKIFYPKIKIVWHDHNGNRLKLSKKVNEKIIWASCFFNGAVACNPDLAEWAKANLKTKNTKYLPNFTQKTYLPKQSDILLKGSENKRIICLANLRNPKNHHFLIRAFAKSKVYEKDWTLHLVGNDYDDDYSKTVKQEIQKLNLAENVFIYGSSTAVFSVLKQAQIGILASVYEGFPVTLLEYAFSNLAVISSNVGFCPNIISSENGITFNPNDENELVEALLFITADEEKRKWFAQNLTNFAELEFSEKKVIPQLLDFYKTL